MELGIQLYGPVARGTLELTELFQGLKNIGYTFVEPCISLDGTSGAPTFWKAAACEEHFQKIKAAGLKAISCHVSADDYKQSIPVMVELAKKYGIRFFVVGMPELTEDAVLARAEVYKKVGEALREVQAELLLHNGKSDIAVKLQGMTAYEFMIQSCDGMLGMQFDTGWAARGGEDPLTIMKRNESSMKSLHYKDFDMTKDTDVDVCIGDGTLDNEGFLRFGERTGIPMLVDADTYDDILADAAKSYHFLEGLK